MAGEKDKDGNIIVDPKDLGAAGGGDSEGGKGTEGNGAGGNGTAAGALTKEDIQTIVKDSIAEAVKDVVTPELDRRISGATKTIYSKVELKKEPEPGDKTQLETAGVLAATKELANRREMVSVYAESMVKEELGKLEPEIQAIVDKILPLEISGIDFEDGISNKDYAIKRAAAVTKTIKDMQGKIETAKVEKLKQAGQIIDVGTGGGKPNHEDDFETGKKLAEERHKKKK